MEYNLKGLLPCRLYAGNTVGTALPIWTCGRRIGYQRLGYDAISAKSRKSVDGAQARWHRVPSAANRNGQLEMSPLVHGNRAVGAAKAAKRLAIVVERTRQREGAQPFRYFWSSFFGNSRGTLKERCPSTNIPVIWQV